MKPYLLDIANLNPDKIEVRTKYDKKFEMIRIRVKLKEKSK